MTAVSWDFRRVEGALYRLGGPPEPSMARAQTMVRSQPQPQPRGPFRESVDRLDVSFAARGLTREEQVVVQEHYVLGVKRHGVRVRRPIVDKLLQALEEG